MQNLERADRAAVIHSYKSEISRLEGKLKLTRSLIRIRKRFNVGCGDLEMDVFTLSNKIEVHKQTLKTFMARCREKDAAKKNQDRPIL